MGIKHIYLVRHGQTEANRTHTHQDSDEVLTAKGRLQAKHVAHFLEAQKVDTLISSSYVRARQTAEIISEHINIPYSETESVVEVRRPDFLYGQKYNSLGTATYLWNLFIHRENPQWDYSGAENMFALRNRIEDAEATIEKAEGEKIAVVTHDVFMNLFLAHVCREKKLTLAQFVGVLAMTKKTPNTGIVYVQLQENAGEGVCAWQIIESINPTLRRGRVLSDLDSVTNH